MSIVTQRLFRGTPSTTGITLYCLPAVGATTTPYEQWASLFEPDINVLTLASRGYGGFRTREDDSIDAHRLAEHLSAEIAESAADSYAVFGHSFGAILAFETVHRLIRRQSPLIMIVAGSPAPTTEASRSQYRHTLPDDEFLAEVAGFGGIPEELVGDNELREVLLPYLRESFALAETYTTPSPGLLPCPLLLLYGTEDSIAGQEEMNRWQQCTEHTVAAISVPGGHFFVEQNAHHVADIVRRETQSAFQKLKRDVDASPRTDFLPPPA